MGQTMENLLQALRAGSMESLALYERFGRSIGNILEIARARGHLDLDGDIYSLTDKGREACPNRRDPKQKRRTGNQYTKERTHA
jgi:hypothetical protein